MELKSSKSVKYFRRYEFSNAGIFSSVSHSYVRIYCTAATCPRTKEEVKQQAAFKHLIYTLTIYFVAYIR